jgi:hypothetical protein
MNIKNPPKCDCICHDTKENCKICKHNNKGYCEYWEDEIKNFAPTQCTAYEPKEKCSRCNKSLWDCKCDCVCHDTKEKDWEKEFDEKFLFRDWGIRRFRIDGAIIKEEDCQDELKSWIQQTFISKQKLREELEGTKEPMLKCPTCLDYEKTGYHSGGCSYNGWRENVNIMSGIFNRKIDDIIKKYT